MKAPSIRKYLRASNIMGRKSTIAGAFASALSPFDIYVPVAVAQALRDLEQDPEAELQCVYCGEDAATWDHVFNRVVKGEFSGHGHRIRNLVPSCRTCNERKGRKHWREFLERGGQPDKDMRIRRMERFLSSADAQPIGIEAMKLKAEEELSRFLDIRSRVFELLTEADRLALIIRKKTEV